MATRVTRASVEAQPTTVVGYDRLVSLRLAAAKSEAHGYGVRRAYAEYLSDKLGKDFWKKKSLGYADFCKEREAYDVALKAEGHSNPSQAHARLREAALLYQNGYDTIAKGPRSKKALAARAEAEIGALFRAFEREEEKSGLDDREEVIFAALRVFIGATGIKVTK